LPDFLQLGQQLRAGRVAALPGHVCTAAVAGTLRLQRRPTVAWLCALQGRSQASGPETQAGRLQAKPRRMATHPWSCAPAAPQSSRRSWTEPRGGR
jgi:hypothetical protein